VWIQAGHFVATSDPQFDTLTECESDARENGYVDPCRKLMFAIWTLTEWVANIALCVAAVGLLLIIWDCWFR